MGEDGFHAHGPSKKTGWQTAYRQLGQQGLDRVPRQTGSVPDKIDSRCGPIVNSKQPEYRSPDRFSRNF